MYFKLALGNVRKSIRDYGIYFLTLVFGVCVFYAFNSITQQSVVLQMSEIQSGMLELLSTLISGVSVFVAVILGFLIVYASRYLIRRRKKEFGTYLLLGMPTGKVSRIIIYETLFVGLISLIIGLVLGILLSQVLLYITAALFVVKMDMFVFVFSWESLIQTILYFGVIFIIALLFNALTVSRYKLIDLIYADKKHEHLKLRSIPLSVVLVVLSIVFIGAAYLLLLDNGMKEFDAQFLASTVLVIIGTLLFFYSLAGFLLRAIQANKKFYLRGLNLFTLRQLNARINTAFISISLVCMALFLAITSTCAGFAMCTTFTDNLKSSTNYDASLLAYFGPDAEELVDSVQWRSNAEADEYDMVAALERDITDWDELVSSSVQIDLYDSDITFGYMLDHSDVRINNSLITTNAEESMLSVVPLSDLNGLREMAGLNPLTLKEDEYLLWCDFEELKDMYRSVLDRGEVIELSGKSLHPAELDLETISTQTSALNMNTGALVVSDSLIEGGQVPVQSILNVMYNGGREDINPLFVDAMDVAYQEIWENDSNLMGWPCRTAITAVQMYEQNVGISVTITYLAIYIGFILLITCAAILALQQLTEAADNVSRYSLLKKLGVEESMINKALFVQIGAYFVFPLILALCHSIVALSVVTDLVTIYGHLEILGPLVSTLALFIVIYGGYFLLTYFASRTMINASRHLTT